MTVYLVGAGPGDPNLLTLRAATLLAQADVVIHDRLVDPVVIAMARRDAIMVDVGKRAGSPTKTQREINELIISYAERYSCVVRLHGGDPYVFGRGGEEAQSLEDGECDYEVVPGVSSFASVAGAAGVPLTQRGVASSFVVVTGHDVDSDEAPATDWDAIARSGATIVVAMGAARAHAISDRLLRAGRSSFTSVLVVERGTTPRQRSSRMTLGDLGRSKIESPAMIVIGDVAQLRYASYEDRPLAGWSVVVTHGVEGDDDARHEDRLVSALERVGAHVLVVPTIAIANPVDEGAALDAALRDLSKYQWIIFSSKNAVRAVTTRLHDARSFGAIKVAAIGSSTARELLSFGVIADYVPNDYVAESFVREFPTPTDKRGRILVPRSASGRDIIEVGLRQDGFEVDVVDAYVTRSLDLDTKGIEAVLTSDIVTVTSSSAVEGLIDSLRSEDACGVVASIGPVTSATARDKGLKVTIEATEHTFDGLVDAIVDYAMTRSS